MMKLFKINYTLIGDLQLPASTVSVAIPQARFRCLSVLLAQSIEQAKDAIKQWRADDFAGRLWNPDVADITYTSYYAASGGEPEEITSLGSHRPLLIGTEIPQEIHFQQE